MTKQHLIRPADLVRYGLLAGVLGTALRNRKEYGVATAWLTHLAGNSVTLLLPDLMRLLPDALFTSSSDLTGALLRTVRRRVWEDPNYAGYAAPLALGFIASHPDYSIYHGRLGELSVYGFGLDSLPHSAAAYGLTRLLSETVLTLQHELPARHRLRRPVHQIAQHVDLLAALSLLLVTLAWETSEYLAHHAEMEATGRPAEEVNMQWSLADSITDTISNALGMGAAMLVSRAQRTNLWTGLPQP